ncbi:MAG: DUF488 domain-containing protein [Nitrososphaerota archaeon]
MIKVKRVYEKPSSSDGYRILVDRLWPRGVRKEDAKIDEWIRDLAPSTGLRKWFGHDISKWTEFKRRYGKEVENVPHLLTRLLELERKHGVITLLFAAKDTSHNNAVALKELLREVRKRPLTSI